MSNHINKHKFDIAEKAVLKSFKMNDKRRIVILLKILDQIQQDNEDARNGIEKSITTISKEEGTSFK